MIGRGFHAGNQASKNTVAWRDLNENGSIDNGEVVSSPGSAASASQTFTRGAMGIDLQVRAKTSLGSTVVLGELVLARNLDRGLYAADPIVTGIDVRELGFHVAATQEIGKYAIAGLRYDVYDPNTDFLIARAGQLLPLSAKIKTISPLVGLVLPGQARLVAQYDIIKDTLAKDARGVPTDLANNQFTLRLQVDL